MSNCHCRDQHECHPAPVIGGRGRAAEPYVMTVVGGSKDGVVAIGGRSTHFNPVRVIRSPIIRNVAAGVGRLFFPLLCTTNRCDKKAIQCDLRCVCPCHT